MEENKEVKKMSYEELEQVATQLSQQVQQLYAKLQHSDMNNTFKRMDYLFKIVEFSNKFNESFVKDCITELEDIMTLPKNDENVDNEK